MIPERSQTDGLNSNDKSMRGFTIDPPESRETLYFDEVVSVDSSQWYHDHETQARNLL